MNTLPLPDAATLMDVTNVTWPAAATHDSGPFTNPLSLSMVNAAPLPFATVRGAARGCPLPC